jgi:hypothetical protein
MGSGDLWDTTRSAGLSYTKKHGIMMLRAAFLGALLSSPPESTTMMLQRDATRMLHPSPRAYPQVVSVSNFEMESLITE